jgi:hypothetical protein
MSAAPAFFKIPINYASYPIKLPSVRRFEIPLMRFFFRKNRLRFRAVFTTVFSRAINLGEMLTA